MNGFSRRDFLSGGLAAGSAAALPMRLWAATEPDLRFGVLSDIHIRTGFDASKNETEFGTEVLVRTLRYFASQHVDAVMICGDMADLGSLDELKHVAAAWKLVFPNDRGPDGRKVEKLFIYGNHDMDGFTYGLSGTRAEQEVRFRASIASDPAAAWEACFHEPFEPVYHKQVRGYSFVGSHWDHWKIRAGFNREAFVDRLIGAADPHRPFFYFQHPHPKGTCFGKGAWGCDEGGMTKVLAKHPNAVAFSGHSHFSMTDELAVWQDAFTSIGVGSLSNLSARHYRENTTPWSGYDMARQMNTKDLDASVADARHGLLVSVYGNRMVVERREFLSGHVLDEDWTLEVPVCGGRAATFARRAEAAKQTPPAFPSEARLAFSRQRFKARGVPGDWKACQRTQLCLEFPSAHAGSRVVEYEVTVEELLADYSRVLRQKRVVAPDFALAKEEFRPRAFCYFAYPDEIPKKGELRFTVVPLDSFGNGGAPLVQTVRIDVPALPERKVRQI